MNKMKKKKRTTTATKTKKCDEAKTHAEFSYPPAMAKWIVSSYPLPLLPSIASTSTHSLSVPLRSLRSVLLLLLLLLLLLSSSLLMVSYKRIYCSFCVWWFKWYAFGTHCTHDDCNAYAQHILDTLLYAQARRSWRGFWFLILGFLGQGLPQRQVQMLVAAMKVTFGMRSSAVIRCQMQWKCSRNGSLVSLNNNKMVHPWRCSSSVDRHMLFHFCFVTIHFISIFCRRSEAFCLCAVRSFYNPCILLGK